MEFSENSALIRRLFELGRFTCYTVARRLPRRLNYLPSVPPPRKALPARSDSEIRRAFCLHLEQVCGWGTVYESAHVGQ
jgi:hypothetical protein